MTLIPWRFSLRVILHEEAAVAEEGIVVVPMIVAVAVAADLVGEVGIPLEEAERTSLYPIASEEVAGVVVVHLGIAVAEGLYLSCFCDPH
jgi:hypothetical protein